MRPLPVVDLRAFRARTLQVVSVQRIEAMLDLDFGVHIQRTFEIDGIGELNVKSQDEWAAARHCMIVLLGGKQLVVHPDASTREVWYRTSPIRARVYLLGRIRGNPIGYVADLPGVGGPALDVGPYIARLAQDGFEIDFVKETINGGSD